MAGDKEISISLGLMLITKSNGTPPALHLCKEVAEARPDFQGLDSGLATQALRKLSLNGQSQKDNVKSDLNDALGGVWQEARVHSVFEVGELCVRRGETVKDLEHIVHHCPVWAADGHE
eukprot:750457-Amphidinium_carterae.1